MENITPFGCRYSKRNWTKILLIMKLMAVLILVASLQVSAKTYSQDRISVDFNHTMLSRALKIVERKSSYRFVFSNDVLSDNMKVSLKADNIEVKDLLNQLLDNTDLMFNILNNNLIAIKYSPAHYKNVTIKGRVTDNKGNPLPNVSVTNGKGEGTATNEMGEYHIEMNENDSLTFSFVGYTSQTVAISHREIINVTLFESTYKLSDIVIVGYGTQKKINLTGAVSTVSGSVLTKRPVSNAANMLEGLLPGVSVVQTNGQPGEGRTKIQVRGFGTFSGAGVNPLILVDGVPGNIEDLNPSVIESVTVLKDAASAAIYGSRGANGVILVTTKNGTGSNGKIQVQYDFNYGSHSPTKLLDLVTNSPDYMRAWNTYIRNNNYGVDIPSQQYTE